MNCSLTDLAPTLWFQTQRKGAIADESSKIAFGMLSAGGTAFPRSGGGKKEAEGKGKEGGKAKGGVSVWMLR